MAVKNGKAEAEVEKWDPSSLPFICDDDDHAETPQKAYNDVKIFLEASAMCVGKEKAELCVYDPYYCKALYNTSQHTLVVLPIY